MVKNKNILIPGGAGFLGSFVSEVLSKQNNVVVIDDLSNGSKDNLKNCIKDVSFIKAKVWNKKSLDVIKNNKFDYILNMYANSYIPVSVSRPFYDFQTNIVAPLKLMEFIRHYNKNIKMIFVSSAAVHGDNINTNMTEDMNFKPISPYGASKASLEYYVKIYSDIYNIKAMCVRMFPMYGPRQKKQVVYDLLKKIYSNSKILEVYGSGYEVRDFIYVEDAANGIIKLMTKGDFKGSAVNMCTGKGKKIRELVACLLKDTNISKEVKYTKKLRTGDVSQMVGCTKLLKNKYGIEAKHTFDQGLKKTVEWFKTIHK